MPANAPWLGGVNPISASSWLWRALRGHSVTFAALFACSLLGLSVFSEFRGLLDRIDAPWYVWLLAPIVLVSALAKKEQEWIPDARKRLWWARGLVIGSIVAVILIASLAPEPKPASHEPTPIRTNSPLR
ncbi:hypothetical protein Oter_0246 [Opitutus terrae PB90-1]|uniref:Uncharacterized protein n=1 Tax=Opitutus terrae (strain DSM 11246 / JCM 15787 / PB90-1) TaxID=452637 RepID=B1ZPD2_OPITP|nr:hypothetical protein Oter_0246 [Opitutus terrae PB90-1]